MKKDRNSTFTGKKITVENINIVIQKLTVASSPVFRYVLSNWTILRSFPPPVTIEPSFRTQMENTGPSWTLRKALVTALYPRE